MTILSEKAQKLIAKQRQRYIESMPDKRDAILQCIAQIRTAVQSEKPDLCEQPFQHIHRLAGSAGSYDFEDMGQAASAVDRYLVAKSLRPGPEDLPMLESLMKKLLDEIDRIIEKHA